jgi:hypothetical protein
MAKPRRDLECIGVGSDRLFHRRLGERCHGHPQLAIAMIELADKHFFVFRHNDPADNAIALSDDPRR